MPDTEVKLDPQDPLPETDWRWRRSFVYALTLILCAFISYAITSLHYQQDAEAVYQIAVRLIYLVAMLATYYMVAPSAEQIVHLVQAARTLRAGVPFATRSKVENKETGHVVTTEVAAGSDAVAPPPPPPVEEEERDFAPSSSAPPPQRGK